MIKRDDEVDHTYLLVNDSSQIAISIQVLKKEISRRIKKKSVHNIKKYGTKRFTHRSTLPANCESGSINIIHQTIQKQKTPIYKRLHILYQRPK